jgi:glycosyltransferase involved in cell wall biosynthesis
MKSTISIALCTYNGAKYLSSQLESYLAQSRLPDEVVVCDDCSQDETVAILQDFAARAPFSMRVVVNDRNIGSSKNFEKAISLCSGDIIFLSDQDDVWAPSKIEEMVREFDANQTIGMVVSNAEFVDETLQPLGAAMFDRKYTDEEKRLIEKGDLFPVQLKSPVVIGGAMAFRARYGKIIIPIPTDIPEMIHDEWIGVAISAFAKSVVLYKPLIKYRQHDEQQTGVANYIPIGFRLLWKESLERVERRHIAIKERAESLKGHLVSRADLPENALNALNAEIQYQQEFARHYQLRKDLPGSHLRRFWPVIRELSSGRYHRFSNGVRSAVRDLVVDHARVAEYHEIMDKRKALIGASLNKADLS